MLRHIPPDQARSSAATAISEAPTYRHPDFDGAIHATSFQQPAGDEASTENTVRMMFALASEDADSPAVQVATECATRGTRTDKEAAAGIFDWILRRITYRTDEDNAMLAGLPDQQTELLIRPCDLLAMRNPAGDCDDFATLTAAMLLARGIEPRIRTIAADETAPHTYTHVYAVAAWSDSELALDSSTAAQAIHPPAADVVGFEARSYKTKTWRLPPMRQLAGLGFADAGSSPTATGVMPGYSGAGSGFDWGSIINTTIKAAAQVAIPAVTQQPRPGTYMSTGPNGQSVYYSMPTGTAAASGLSLPGLSTGSLDLTSMLMIGGVVLAAVLLLARKS